KLWIATVLPAPDMPVMTTSFVSCSVSVMRISLLIVLMDQAAYPVAHNRLYNKKIQTASYLSLKRVQKFSYRPLPLVKFLSHQRESNQAPFRYNVRLTLRCKYWKRM